jgi:exonuclease III
MLSLNGLNWNIRGIVDAHGKKPLILDTLGRTHASIICFQETKKEQMSDSYLRSLVNPRDFTWNFLPAIGTGTAGGILLGVDNDVYDIIS